MEFFARWLSCKLKILESSLLPPEGLKKLRLCVLLSWLGLTNVYDMIICARLSSWFEAIGVGFSK
jgi:hypothetical protein